jgi:hypothetical protein
VITLNEDNQLKKKEVNKHSKFDKNFDIQHQLEHCEYVMIHAEVVKSHEKWFYGNQIGNFK